MLYIDFRDAILGELQQHPAGLTWAELQSRLGLPATRPCPIWIGQLEREIGLSRTKGDGRMLVWKVPQPA